MAFTPDAPVLRRLLKPNRLRYADIRGERELELVRAAKAGDRRAWETLDQAHLPLVFTVLRRYFRRGVPAEDLLQEGRLGLRHAVDKFDESRGVPFMNYATHWVRHFAEIYLAQNCADIRVAPRVRRAFIRLRRSGKAVDDLALTGRADDRSLLENFLAVVHPVHLDAPQLFGADREERGTLGEQVPHAGPLPDEMFSAAEKRAYREKVVARAVASLPKVEREVVLRRYPLDEAVEPQSQVEIATRFESGARGEIRVTRQRIQQVEKQAMARLKVRLRVADPEGHLLED